MPPAPAGRRQSPFVYPRTVAKFSQWHPFSAAYCPLSDSGRYRTSAPAQPQPDRPVLRALPQAPAPPAALAAQWLWSRSYRRLAATTVFPMHSTPARSQAMACRFDGVGLRRRERTVLERSRPAAQRQPFRSRRSRQAWRFTDGNRRHGDVVGRIRNPRLALSIKRHHRQTVFTRRELRLHDAEGYDASVRLRAWHKYLHRAMAQIQISLLQQLLGTLQIGRGFLPAHERRNNA